MVMVLRHAVLASPAGSTRALGRDEMLALARGVDLDRLEFGDFHRFTDERYARNTVFLNEYVELVVICWMGGQASSIHDHGASNCLYLVVDGTMQEEMFRLDADGRPERTSKRIYARGDITVAAPTDVHRIVNPGDGGLVTVHLYSPPLDQRVTNFTPIPIRAHVGG